MLSQNAIPSKKQLGGSLSYAFTEQGVASISGELTLTGKILPIGGVKEKTIAARRVGIFELIFPKENKNDFEELPNYIKKGITAHFVDYFKDVLIIAYK